MQGIVITIPGSFTDQTLPRMPLIDINVNGTLLDLDLATAFGTSSLPVTGSKLTDRAWQLAQPIMGGTSETLKHTLTYFDQTKILTYKTGRGGLGFKWLADSGANINEVNLSDVLKTYLNNNQSHKYYFSVWMNNRVLNYSGDRTPFAVRAAGNANDIYTIMGDVASDLSWAPPVSSGKQLLKYKNPEGTWGSKLVGPIKLASAVDGASHLTGGTTPPAQQARFYMANWSGSHMVLYRIYIEDLTVSGRTVAAVNALDDKFFTEQVLSDGGQYYGDTFS